MHSKEVNELDLELAVRSLGLPEKVGIDFKDLENSLLELVDVSGSGIHEHMEFLKELRKLLYTTGYQPTLELTFRIPLSSAIEQYLPEMEKRYENWVKFHQAMATGKSPFDND